MKVWKWVLTVFFLLLALIAALTVRVLLHTNYFMEVESIAGNQCEVVTNIKGPEDLDIDPETGLVYVSAFDIRPMMAGEKPADGAIYVFDPQSPEGNFQLALEAAPEDFHPHGISFFSGGDRGKQLYVVNHSQQGEAVEIFDVLENGRLLHNETIFGDGLVALNDLTVVAPRQFYFTNDDNTANNSVKFLHSILGGRQGNISFYDGSEIRVVNDGMAMANGIKISADGSELYAVDMQKMELYLFNRHVNNSLTLSDTMKFDIPLDNLSLDSDGNIWVAGQGPFFDLIQNLRDASHPSPSQVAKVIAKDGRLVSYEKVYADSGEQFPSATVALPHGGYYYLGSVGSEGILRCKLPE